MTERKKLLQKKWTFQRKSSYFEFFKRRYFKRDSYYNGGLLQGRKLGRKIIVPKYLRNLHDILRTEKDDLSVKKTKQKQTKNSKMIFYLA